MESSKSQNVSGGFRFLPVLLTLLFAGTLLTRADPTISNTHASSTDDKTTVLPFSSPNVSISSAQVQVTVVVTLDLAKASLTNLADFTDNGAGSYTLTGDPAVATSELRDLVFVPVENRIDPGSTEMDIVTIIATDSDGSVTNSDTVVSVISVDDPPTISGIVANRSITDKQSTNLFAGFSFADVDLFGTQHITIDILQDDNAKGVIRVDSSGFASNSPIHFTFTGTPAEATTAIRLLNFRPTENREPVGTNETTYFTLSVTDASGEDATISPLTTTVMSLSINDPPTVSGISSTHRLLQTGRTNSPFTGGLIADVDVGDNTNHVGQNVKVEATFAGSSADGRWINPSGLGFISGSTYIFSNTIANANHALNQLAYQAQSFPLSGTNTITFSVVVTDDHGGSVTNTAAADDVYTPYTPPGLSGTRSNQRMNDNATLALFSGVTIQSFNGGAFSVIVQLDQDAKGQLVNLAGFVKYNNTSPASYIFSGTSENATAAIRQILFQPTINRISGATTETTYFSIFLVDGGVTNGPDTSTSVIVSPVNDAPTIQGISPLATIPDNATIAPFPTVLITDVDESGQQVQTVTVSLDDTNKGSFTTNSLATAQFVTDGLGQYTGSGSPANVTAALRQLVFAPTPNRLPAGSAENTTFTLTSVDGQGGVAVNGGTVIRVVAVAGGPVFNLPNLPLSIQVATNVSPFSSVSVTDPQSIALTLQVTNSNWGSFTPASVAAAGFTNAGPGTYRIGGSANNVTAALQSLVFAPNLNLALGTLINFTLSATDQAANTTTVYMTIVLRLNQLSHIVTKTTDYDPNDHSVTTNQMGGTLRKAIEDASSNDHITFDIRSSDPGLPDYPATIALKANLILNKNLTIDGPGADLLSISGDSDGDGVGDQEIFEVDAQVTINRLTLTKGHHPFAGGAIEVGADGCLTLSYCAITDSSADVWGGGIDVNGGCLSMDHCLVSGNRTSAAFGEGGGGISLYSDSPCYFVNTTFAGNRQLASSGLGGGALYAENLDPGSEFDVYVLNCTFHENTDAASHGTSIRPNVFNAEVWLQNTMVADGQGKNLEMDDSGDVISLGGNLSDDGTRTIFSIGGYPYDTTIFQHPPDFTNVPPNVLPLTNNLGPTLTYALAFNSAAIDSSVSNKPGATYYNTQGTDQRGYWRSDLHPDIGAFERNASQRVVIQEILFANTNDQFIEFYVPRDSGPLNLANFKVLVHGQLLHTFAPAGLQPGEAIVLFSKTAMHTTVPSGVYSQIASNNVLMNPSADTITLLNPSNQVVLQVSYVGTFVSSDPNDPGFLTISNQSIVYSPPFQGDYLPYLRVAAHTGGPTNVNASPGYDPAGTLLSTSNSPPKAFNDLASTDAQTPLPTITVLSNDKDLDVADAIRVVGVGVTNALMAGVTNLSSTSHYGAAIVVNALGASVSFDPRASQFLTSLPQGSNVVDWFQYTILDSSNGLDHVRGSSAGEISNNIVRATATVLVSVTGVNLPPTPQDDSIATNPGLTVSEDGMLDFTTADTILANDTDPNTDDNASTLTIIAIEPTSTYQNSLQAISALGAFVTLDIRFSRNQTHILYDPRGSAVLNSLGNGQTAVDTFYYSVMDRYGAIGTAAVHITVVGTNDFPQANADSLATDEDTPLTIPFATLLGNDIDPDTGITNPVPPHLIISAVDAFSAMGALVQIVGTNVVYDPTVSSNLNALARKESVVDTFTYTAQDDYGYASNAVVSVTVSGRNDPPIPLPDFYSTGEKTRLPIAAPGVLSNDRDPDVNGTPPDDTIRVIPFTRTSTRGAAVTMNADGSFSYDPRGVFDWLAQGQTTNDTFTYTLMDHSLTVANDDTFIVQGNSSFNVLPVLANDALLSQVGGALTIISVSTPTKAGAVSIDASTTNLIYSPAPNFVGIETFSYVISDGFGGTDFATVTVTVTVDPLNGNLVANADSFTVAKGTTVTLDVLANDNIKPASGAALTVVSVGTPDHGGTVSINGGGPNNVLTYSPNSANIFPLTETFSYVISGGGVARATGTVSVALIDRANTLTANEDSFSVIANGANYPLDVLANDLILPGPNTNLSITSIQTNGVNGTVSINAAGTGLLYRPPSGVTNHEEPVITYTISDGAGGTASSAVSIFVLSSASSGFFANDDIFSVTKNSQSNTLSVLLNDAVLPNTGQTLTITDIGLDANSPNHGGSVSINSAGNALIYSPSNSFVGDETFTYEISYGTVARAQGHVFVHVVDTTTLPSRPDAYNVAKNSSNNTLPVLANDYNLPPTLLALTISGLETNGVLGSVAINGSGFDNTLSYTPATGFIGRESFGYETSDGRGNKGTNLIIVTVGNLTPRDDQFSVLSDSTSNPLDVLTNDAFLPDTTTVRPICAVGVPDHGGTATTNGGGTRVLYSPAPGFVGTEHFTYSVKDDSGVVFSANATVSVIRAGSDRATSTVTVTVIGTNDPPTIVGAQAAAITDKQTLHPFTNVVIGDLDAFGLQPLTVQVIFDNPIKGLLQNLGGFVPTASGVYTMHGVASNITSSIHGLLFVPTQNRITVPTNENTILTITADDGYVTSPVSNSATVINVTSVNDPPVFSGTQTNLRVYDHLTIMPFAGVTVTEVDNLGLQPLTIGISLDIAKGYLTSLGGFIDQSNGVYALTNVTAVQATAALRSIIYVPTPNGRLLPGGSETNLMTLSANDGFAPTVIDSTTTVISMDAFIKKVASDDGNIHDVFAYSVSANRDLVAAGTPNGTGTNSVKSGIVTLFTRNTPTNEAWSQIAKLAGSDSAANDQFGFGVGLNKDTLAAGAPNASVGSTRSGAAYVFSRTGSNAWSQVKKLTPADGANGDLYGTACAVAGDTIVVGSYVNKNGASRTGAAYIYGRNQGGSNQWGLVKKLFPADGADLDHFGLSLAISGDTIVVGSDANSPLNNNNRAGAVYVFDRNQGGTNNWGQTRKISAADGLSNDGLGHSVSVSGDLIIAGAPFVSINNSRSGRIYLFSRNQGGSNQWGQANEFLPFDNVVGSQFGISVTVDGELFAAGTLLDVPQGGAVYVYTRNWPGLSQWTPLEKIVPSTNDTYEAFGAGISLSSNTLAVGAHFDDTNNNRIAETYIYRLKFNNSPFVAARIPDQIVPPSQPFSFPLPVGTFTDADVNDSLTYALGAPPTPPVWLTFNPATGVFGGNPGPTLSSYPVSVVATDTDGATASTTFNIIVSTLGTNQAPTDPLSVWRLRWFGPQALDPTLEATVWGNAADPDGDGVPNIQEYLFGTNPTSPDPLDRVPLVITPSGNPGTTVLSFKFRADDPRLTYGIQTSPDLLTWQPLDNAHIISTMVTQVDGGIYLSVIEVLVSSNPQFFRVAIAINGP